MSVLYSVILLSEGLGSSSWSYNEVGDCIFIDSIIENTNYTSQVL